MCSRANDRSITFTFDGNADTRQSTLQPDLSLVNFDKYAKLGKIAVEFKRYQEVRTLTPIVMEHIANPRQPFNFHALEPVQAYLKRVLAERGSSSIDALYRKSRELAPPRSYVGPWLIESQSCWNPDKGKNGYRLSLKSLDGLVDEYRPTRYEWIPAVQCEHVSRPVTSSVKPEWTIRDTESNLVIPSILIETIHMQYILSMLQLLRLIASLPFLSFGL